MLTEKQIAVVTDPVADGPEIEYVSSPLDIYGPIDFDKLREATNTLGPLRMRSPVSPYSIEVDVKECRCGCGTSVVRVVRRNGVFSIRWILDEEDLLAYSSLEEFKNNVLAGSIMETSGERQIIEGEIERTFDTHYSEVEPQTCFCEECATRIGKDALWRRMLLSQLAANLSDRHTETQDARKAFATLVSNVASKAAKDGLTRNERKMARDAAAYLAESFSHAAFDLGYQTGRLYSEFQVKDGIEEHALAGMHFEDIKARRAQGGGKTSSGKRLERMTALLAFMEKLAAGSPALLRTGPLQVAQLACQDAVAADPALWSQGAGQVEEYLGQIRRGEAGDDLKARYFALFPVQPKHSRKTA